MLKELTDKCIRNEKVDTNSGLMILNIYCVQVTMFSVETVKRVSEIGSKLISNVQWRV